MTVTRIEELNDSPLRIARDEFGRIVDIIDDKGVSQGFVFGQVDKVTGRVRKSVGGKPILRSTSLMSGVGTQSLGRNDAVSTTSYHKIIGVAQPFSSVRLIVRNYGASLESGKNSFAVASVGSVTDNVTSLTPVTWGGGYATPYAASLFNGTVASTPFTGHTEISVSDPIPLPSVVRTDGQSGGLLAIRQVANGSIVYAVPGAGEHASEQVTAGVYVSAMSQKAGDFVTTNQSGYGTPSFGAGLNIDTVDVIFGCDVSTLIVAQSGDSIEAGVLGIEGRGNGVRLATADIAATGKPVSFANLAMPAGRVGTYTERAIQFIERFGPAVVFYTPMTPNTDSGQIGEAVNIAEAKAWLTQMVAACDLAGTHLVICTCSPWYSTTIAQDNGIKSFNAYLAAFATQFGFGFYDRYSLFSDGASPARLKAGYAGSDNAHPSVTAYESERIAVRQILDQLLPF